MTNPTATVARTFEEVQQALVNLAGLAKSLKGFTLDRQPEIRKKIITAATQYTQGGEEARKALEIAREAEEHIGNVISAFLRNSVEHLNKLVTALYNVVDHEEIYRPLYRQFSEYKKLIPAKGWFDIAEVGQKYNALKIAIAEAPAKQSTLEQARLEKAQTVQAKIEQGKPVGAKERKKAEDFLAASSAERQRREQLSSNLLEAFA